MHAAGGSGVDFEGITKKQQTVWATGDFNEIARQVMAVADELVRSVDPHAGQSVLDIACGSGNAVHLQFEGEDRLRRSETAEGAVRRGRGRDRLRADANIGTVVRARRVNRPTRQHHG